MGESIRVTARDRVEREHEQRRGDSIVDRAETRESAETVERQSPVGGLLRRSYPIRDPIPVRDELDQCAIPAR